MIPEISKCMTCGFWFRCDRMGPHHTCSGCLAKERILYFDKMSSANRRARSNLWFGMLGWLLLAACSLFNLFR